MTTSLTEFQTQSDQRSESILPYRKCCCCICTRSGSNDLFGFNSYTSRLEDVRESATLSPLSLERNHHNYRRLNHSEHSSSSSHSEQQTLSYKVAISGGIIWLIQYGIYSMLFSVYPLKYMETETSITNLYAVVIIITLMPFTSLFIIPLFQSYEIIYALGLSRCIIIGLLSEGTLCILFEFIPLIVGPNNLTAIYILDGIIRILCAISSALIELAFISTVIELTPPKVLSGQQCMPLFCMMGLMSGPIVSGYFYCFGYDLPFAIIGIMIIISTFVVYLYLPNNVNNAYTSSISYLSAFGDMNIIYSSMMTMYSLISITYLMFILSPYLNRIDPTYFSAQNDRGISHIAIYYMAFGLSFIILSFPAGTITYRNCGSLRTMFCGMCGMSIGLLFVSTATTSYILPAASLVHVLNGLVIVGISAAFGITPYLLYIRNAIYVKYRERTTEISFDIYRFVVCFGILIGPMIACLNKNNDIDTIQLTLFILSVIAFCISLIGIILFKCVQWKWLKNGSKMKYIPILQDDKPFCCCCPRIMCFFSFGAFCDPKYKKRKRKEKKNRMRSRRSFDETLTPKKRERVVQNENDRISFGGSHAESEYDDDDKGKLKGKKAADKKENFMLSQSWNTILNKNKKMITRRLINRDRSTSSENGTRSTSLTREKSRILTADDMHNIDKKRNIEKKTSYDDNALDLMKQHSTGTNFSYSSSKHRIMSSTEQSPHTFLLLTDEDFASKQGSGDIYDQVPETDTGALQEHESTTEELDVATFIVKK